MKATHTCWLLAIFITFFSSSSFGDRIDQDLTLNPSFRSKCRGQWAIHACFGGNGKRSSPPTEFSKPNQNDQLLLRKILLQNSDLDNYGINNYDLTQSEPIVVEETSGFNGLDDLKSLSDLVQELIYRQRLREFSEESELV